MSELSKCILIIIKNAKGLLIKHTKMTGKSVKSKCANK